MNLAEFTAAVKTTKMRQKTIDAVRMVLVDGKKEVEVVALTGMKQQQVNEAVRRIEAAHAAMRGVPEDWQVITVCVPPGRVADVREIEKAAMREAGLSVD